MSRGEDQLAEVVGIIPRGRLVFQEMAGEVARRGRRGAHVGGQRRRFEGGWALCVAHGGGAGQSGAGNSGSGQTTGRTRGDGGAPVFNRE